MRTACTADVKDIFDRIDVHKRGTLTVHGIADAARQLGFPLGDGELKAAMKNMDSDASGGVSFPEFLMWWNSSEQSNALHQKILSSCTEG